MREIKFRAWDTITKEIKLAEEILFNDGEVVFGYEEDVPMWRPLRSVILMQYIGLKDKNGKEIYEGDILFDDDIDAQWYASVYIGDWGPMLKFVNGDEEYISEFQLYDSEKGGWVKRTVDLKIVGNIYENSELLK